ncbi:hypothetical protein D3C76_1120850 [compost metagenome]
MQDAVKQVAQQVEQVHVEAFAPGPGIGELREHEAQPLVAQQEDHYPVQQAQQAIGQVIHVLHVEQRQLADANLLGALAHQLRQHPTQLASPPVGGLDQHQEDHGGQGRPPQRLE